MASVDHLEYECLQCGFRLTPEDSLVSTCPRCGGEMRNARRITT